MDDTPGLRHSLESLLTADHSAVIKTSEVQLQADQLISNGHRDFGASTSSTRETQRMPAFLCYNGEV